jgi:predicted DNA-binding protein (UPF0251 family)/predicted Fe-Mo cluster-binding NifX family protein
VPRPRKCRWVQNKPPIAYFKPRGVPMRELTEVNLTVEGAEALRLADLESLSHQEAAERMKVSRHTFGRVLAEARQVVAEAVVLGRALRIDGGDYAVRSRKGQPSPQPDQNDSPANELENNMNKIAISSEGPTLDDLLDPRFGRAGGFVIYDPETKKAEYLNNGTAQSMSQGAGIQAAETVAKAGAKVLLTGYVGPKAFKALQAVGIQVGQDLEGLTVGQAIERYESGKVEIADGPNREQGGRA